MGQRIVWSLGLLALLGGLLQGCDTMAALGRDVQKVGKSIEKKAEEKSK